MFFFQIPHFTGWFLFIFVRNFVAACGAIFASTSCLMASLRKEKNDHWNYVMGGIAAGASWGMLGTFYCFLPPEQCLTHLFPLREGHFGIQSLMERFFSSSEKRSTGLLGGGGVRGGRLRQEGVAPQKLPLLPRPRRPRQVPSGQFDALL